MKPKINIAKMIDKVKASLKSQPMPPVAPAPQSGARVRDMRQEAKEAGSYGASEFFGEGNV